MAADARSSPAILRPHQVIFLTYNLNTFLLTISCKLSNCKRALCLSLRCTQFYHVTYLIFFVSPENKEDLNRIIPVKIMIYSTQAAVCLCLSKGHLGRVVKSETKGLTSLRKLCKQKTPVKHQIHILIHEFSVLFIILAGHLPVG